MGANDKKPIGTVLWPAMWAFVNSNTPHSYKTWPQSCKPLENAFYSYIGSQPTFIDIIDRSRRTYVNSLFD